MTELLYLGLNNNQITDAGALKLLSQLKTMKLKQLFLYENQFSKEMKAKYKSELTYINSRYSMKLDCNEQDQNDCPANR
jgi:Leucine-rich repeat (LRR) protein